MTLRKNPEPKTVMQSIGRTIGWKSWTKWTPFQGTVPHSSHWMVIIFVMFPLRSRTLVPAPRLWPPVPRAGAGWDATRPLEKKREKWWVNGIWMGFSGIQWTLDGDLTGQWWCHGIYIGFSGSWWDLNGDSMGYEWFVPGILMRHHPLYVPGSN